MVSVIERVHCRVLVLCMYNKHPLTNKRSIVSVFIGFLYLNTIYSARNGAPTK